MEEIETENAEPIAPHEKKDGNDRYLIPGAIIVAGALVAGAVYYSSVAQKTAILKDGAGKTQNTPTVKAEDLYGASDPALGNPSASVSVVEFSDFQCPFCGRFFKETEPQIIANYVKTGKVKFVYKDFAFLGDESVAAAHAARCAGEQGKFWQYHDYLFKYIWDNYYGKGKGGENVGAFSETHLLQFAGAVGLNQADFAACVKSGKYQNAVAASTNTGKQNGVTGTPGIFVDGTLIVGAQPYEEFAKAIDVALAGKK